jgi:hyperosmotically inducible periplasmic protein
LAFQIRKDKAMTMRKAAAVIALTSSIGVCGARAMAQTPEDSATIGDIRSKLLRLPYYGVFDFLAFSYAKGTVTLSGYDYRGTLKADAERAVKQVARVDQVMNNIEELPVSPNDDDLRWKTYYAIYSDPFLSRYAPGGGSVWGHRHQVATLGRFGSAARFPGAEPLGNYPIAIIVKNGHITLMGVVDGESDKTVAGMKAKGVPGSFGVENELTVEKSK